MKAAVLALLCLCLAGSSAAHLSRSGMGHWCFFKSQLQEGFSCTDHSLIRVVLRVAETAHMFWGPRNEAQGRSGMLHGRSASPRNDGDSSTSNAVEMTIMYSKDIRVGNGNIIAENMVQEEPMVQIAGSSRASCGAKQPMYTLLMVDPDAPSPDNPKWADFLHWAVTNITCGDTGHGNVLMDYMAPAPPKGTHRYIFTLWGQMTEDSARDAAVRKRASGGTQQVTASEKRKHFNVAKFAEKNHLQGHLQTAYFRVKS